MEINKVQWRMIAKGAKLPCDSFLMKKDGTMTSMVTGAGVTVGQDAYYLPVEELRSFPKEESEDERIRKELIAEVKEQIDCIPVPDCRDKEDEKALKQLNKWLAWLEKQGEQKPATDFSDLRTWKYIVDAVWTEKEGIGQYLDSPFTEEVAKKLQKRFGNIEHKPTEWSEEDKEKMSSVFLGIEAYFPSIIYGNGKEEVLTWLKSLKDRVQPQSQWKPSDSQMASITCAVRKMKESACYDSELVSLFNDLKKLKGEEL